MLDIDLFQAKLMRKLHGWMEPMLASRDLAALKTLNSTATGKLLADGGPVVSLTTHGMRLDSVYLTIESIGRGRLLPSRLILWVDDPARFAALPDSLQRLQRRGLEVLLTQNFGPHTKYYPYVASKKTHDVPLVTADDDIIYPPDWLLDLSRAARQTPGMICCFRAHRVGIDSAAATATIAPYSQWLPCETRAAEPRNFGTGVSGVIYPPSFLDFLHQQGTAFLDCCPKADDIWLHVAALRSGLKVRQIGRLPKHFPCLPDTQGMGLVHSNSAAGGNDEQIKRSYGASDIALLAGNIF